MLQKNDCGISVKDVIDRIREEYPSNYALLMKIEAIASQVEEIQLTNLRYDEEYLKQHIAFFDAKKVPHFTEKTPEGVFNAEYDCSFDNIDKMNIEAVMSWIREKN